MSTEHSKHMYTVSIEFEMLVVARDPMEATAIAAREFRGELNAVNPTSSDFFAIKSRSIPEPYTPSDQPYGDNDNLTVSDWLLLNKEASHD